MITYGSASYQECLPARSHLYSVLARIAYPLHGEMGLLLMQEVPFVQLLACNAHHILSETQTKHLAMIIYALLY